MSQMNEEVNSAFESMFEVVFMVFTSSREFFKHLQEHDKIKIETISEMTPDERNKFQEEQQFLEHTMSEINGMFPIWGRILGELDKKKNKTEIQTIKVNNLASSIQAFAYDINKRIAAEGYQQVINFVAKYYVKSIK